MNHSRTHAARVLGLALLAAVPAAQAQQRPDAATGIQQAPLQPLEALPRSSAPDAVAPPARPRAFVGPVVQFTPAAFAFSGNTLIPSDELLRLPAVAAAMGRPINFEGLADLADKVREHYVAKGYILTDVYFPEQKFQSEGGTVQFVVVEARIGRVSVRRASDAGITEGQATSLAQTLLPAGALIDQALLDRPVLLLRDMVGTDASATVQPGAQPGEADVVIDVKGRGLGYEVSVSADNQGSDATGNTRVAVQASLDRPLGIGDQLQVRLQASDMPDNHLYRIGYSVPVGPYATKLIGSVSRNVYALGTDDFRSLGANGYARVVSGTVVQPVLRGRYANVMVMAGLDRKSLYDRTAASDPSSETIDTARLGVMGSLADRDGHGHTAASLNLTHGRARFDADDSVLHTRGAFSKLNLDVQRTTYFSAESSVVVGMSAQLASKNLRNAERISYGGPLAVRGYKGPSGTGDEGVMASAEYRYRLPYSLFETPFTASAFYDVGHVKFRVNPVEGLTRRTANFDSLGLGLRVGREGQFVGSAQIAKPMNLTAGGIDQSAVAIDKDPKFWLSLQVWF